MRIIPAIDIMDGKCVRLSQGDFSLKKTYNDDPVDVARTFADSGLRYLHLVDLDGAKSGAVVNWKVVEDIAKQTNLIIDFGGGVKDEETMQRLFDSGVNQINLGSIAVNRPYRVYEWIGKFGADKIIVSADVRQNKVAINGWEKNSDLEVGDFIRGFFQQGLQYVACTDIESDGMLKGPNVSLYLDILKRFPNLKLIASGGVSSMEDVKQLSTTNVDGIIIGKAIYENRITLDELASFNSPI